MSDRVWKFTLSAPTDTGRAWADLPPSARPISVGLQGDDLVVWALVDPEQEAELEMQTTGAHRFIVATTGMVIRFPYGARFLGTVTTDAGIVLHVWDGDAR